MATICFIASFITSVVINTFIGGHKSLVWHKGFDICAASNRRTSETEGALTRSKWAGVKKMHIFPNHAALSEVLQMNIAVEVLFFPFSFLFF